MYHWKTNLIKTFHKCKAIQFGNFTLSSGKQSDYYIDARLVTLSSQGLWDIFHGIKEILETNKIQFDSVGGPIIGADPIVGMILWESVNFMNGFLVRPKTKNHGTNKLVEGVPCDHPILVDDVLTTGHSLIEANKEIGGHAKHAKCVVDRLEGGREALAAEGIKVHSLLTIEDLKNG